MDNNTTATSGANSVTSGAESVDQGQSSTSGETSSTTAYEKLLKEKKNTMSAFQSTKSELEELKSWKAQIEEEKLLKNQEFETVIQNLKKQLDDSKIETKTLNEKIQGSKKNTAVLNELKKLGFVDSDANKELMFKSIDKNAVVTDPTTGVILGADDAAKGFLEKYGALGFFGKKQEGVNHNAPNLNSNVPRDISSMSRQEIDGLSREERWKIYSELKNKGR